MDQIGVVLTKTVAFNIDVSKTAETKSMKCTPKRTPRIATRREAFRKKPKLKPRFQTKITMTRITDAITKRQKATEKTLNPDRTRMKIAAVPNKAPARTPSKRATFLLLDP